MAFKVRKFLFPFRLLRRDILFLFCPVLTPTHHIFEQLLAPYRLGVVFDLLEIIPATMSSYFRRRTEKARRSDEALRDLQRLSDKLRKEGAPRTPSCDKTAHRGPRHLSTCMALMIEQNSRNLIRSRWARSL